MKPEEPLRSGFGLLCEEATKMADKEIAMEEIFRPIELQFLLNLTKPIAKRSLINGIRHEGAASLLAHGVGEKMPQFRNVFKVIGLICDVAPDPMQAVRYAYEQGWIHLSLSRKETLDACAQIESMFKYNP